MPLMSQPHTRAAVADVYKLCGVALRGKIGVATIPGSTIVYNRTSGQLVPCASQDMCPNVRHCIVAACIHEVAQPPLLESKHFECVASCMLLTRSHECLARLRTQYLTPLSPSQSTELTGL